MSQPVSLMRKCIEETLLDSENREFLEKVWLEMNKVGCKLPSSDDLFKIFADFTVDIEATIECKTTTPEAACFYAEIMRCLSYLCQLVLVKERM